MTQPPADVQGIVTQALAFHRAGDAAKAEPLYRKALEIQPNHPEALQLLGALYHQRGHMAQAAELIRRSVEIAPSYVNVGNLAEILRVLGRPKEAIPLFRRSLEMNPDWPETHANLGMTYLDLQQFDDAVRAFERA